MKSDHANIVVARRGKGYDSVRDLWLRTGLGPAVLEKLAAADAFRSLGLNHRDALWAVKGLLGSDGAETLPLFAIAGRPGHRDEPDADLPPMPPGEEVIHDCKSLSLSLKAHPLSFLRETLTRRGIVPADALRETPAGHIVTTAGVVLVRQRPGTASGVIFASLEDETGLANVIVWPKVFEANRRVVLGARLMAVEGEVQKEGLVVHVIARQVQDLTPMLQDLYDGEPAKAALPAGRNFQRDDWNETGPDLAGVPGERPGHRLRLLQLLGLHPIPVRSGWRWRFSGWGGTSTSIPAAQSSPGGSTASETRRFGLAGRTGRRRTPAATAPASRRSAC